MVESVKQLEKSVDIFNCQEQVTKKNKMNKNDKISYEYTCKRAVTVSKSAVTGGII